MMQVYGDTVDAETIDLYIGRRVGADNPKSLRKWMQHFEKLLARGEEFFMVGMVGTVGLGGHLYSSCWNVHTVGRACMGCLLKHFGQTVELFQQYAYVRAYYWRKRTRYVCMHACMYV